MPSIQNGELLTEREVLECQLRTLPEGGRNQTYELQNCQNHAQRVTDFRAWKVNCFSPTEILTRHRRNTLVKQLTEMPTGEIQPFYIYRYGFHEGHTASRTDPVVIAFIFGFKSIQEIEAAFARQLPRVLTQHFISDSR